MSEFTAPKDIPAGWKSVFNEEHQEWFYVNTHTQTSTWDKPILQAQGVAGTQVHPPANSDTVPHNEIRPSASLDQEQTPSDVYQASANASDEKSGLALETEILEEYSFPAESTPSSIISSAYSRKTGSKVIIKRYSKTNESGIARANREILALQAITEAAVPVLVDYFDPADTIFTVTEDTDGESLKRYVEGRGSLSEEMVKSVITQLFSALAQIFCAGFAHLRINSETLFIADDGQLTIKDFEYTHEYVNEKVDDLYAAVEARYGSDIYVAPEVFTTTRYNARKAVIWSCGVAAYYMVTGQTEKLSNLEHPAHSHSAHLPSSTPNGDQSPQRRRSSLSQAFRRHSNAGRKASISAPHINVVSYPGSRFELSLWIRDIISKMLTVNPLKRAELIEVAAKVPKEYKGKFARPLMEVAWNDYKLHAGPYAGLDERFELASSASSMYSGVSNYSNPFGSLLGGRRSSGREAVYTGFV